MLGRLGAEAWLETLAEPTWEEEVCLERATPIPFCYHHLLLLSVSIGTMPMLRPGAHCT